MSRVVAIDFLPESGRRYGAGWGAVAIDVIRATTTAVTAAAMGRRVFPAPTLEAALSVASVLDQPLLAGELGGNMPFGFHITNSPAAVAARTDVERPMVLLSSSGTQLIHNAGGADAVYLASLRNYAPLASHLAATHQRVAVLGAGTRGEFREEDQKCCALIAARLVRAGYRPADDLTRQVIERWSTGPDEAWMVSRSVDYLRRSGQHADLDFVLSHRCDLGTVFRVDDGEVMELLPVTGEPARRRAELV